MMKIDGFFSDIRLAFKLLRKHTSLKLAVIVTLALGIGANSAMFTVLDALLFPALPYSNSRKLVIFQTYWKNGEIIEAVSYPRLKEWQTTSRSFEEVAGQSFQDLILSSPTGPAEPLKAELVTANYFSGLRINAAWGRTFTEAETASAAAAPVAILSDGLWKRRFGGDASVVGKTIHLNERAFTIIGVLPPGFQGISRHAEIWIPITAIGVISTPQLLQSQSAIWVTVIGRLAKGASLTTAQAELNILAGRTPAEASKSNGRRVQLSLLESRGLQRYKLEAYILLGAVIFVLLIASLNVANLLLSYFLDRREELAVRNAVGAPRARLFQQLIIESIVLSVIGGGLGLLLAIIVVRSLGASISHVLAGIGPLGVNLRIFVLTGLVTLLTGTVSGLIPLLQIVIRGMSDHLKGQARTGSPVARSGLRTVLVVGQIGLAVILVVGAGLMLQSILKLGNVDLGFRSDHVLITRLSALAGERYDNAEKMSGFYEALLNKVSGVTKVDSAGFVSSPPLLAPSPSIPFLIRGRSDVSSAHPPSAQYIAVSSGYFAALSIPVLQGRVFERSDSATTQPVVIINEAMSKQYWPGQNPIGQYLNIFDGTEPPKQIIGVVADLKDSGVDAATVSEMYVPYSQIPVGFLSLLKSFPPALAVRSTASPEALAGALRKMVAEIDPSEAVLDSSTLEHIVSESVAQPRLYSEVLGLFAAIALTLAALGIYGVVSYSVSQRTKELGVRMALGATRSKILFQVLGQSMAFTMIGAGVGAVGALALSRVLRTLLFEIQPHDPATVVLAVLILSAVALMAAYFPARRASLIDPGSVLKE